MSAADIAYTFPTSPTGPPACATSASSEPIGGARRADVPRGPAAVASPAEHPPATPTQDRNSLDAGREARPASASSIDVCLATAPRRLAAGNAMGRRHRRRSCVAGGEPAYFSTCRG
jgi:hypothetical protein